MVFRLVDIVSKGGNYLLNVGPTSEGLIPQPSVDRLMEVGLDRDEPGGHLWDFCLRIYGEGPLFDRATAKSGKKSERDRVPRHGASVATEQAPLDIRFTAKRNAVYAICLNWPEKNVLIRALGKTGSPARQ